MSGLHDHTSGLHCRFCRLQLCWRCCEMRPALDGVETVHCQTCYDKMQTIYSSVNEGDWLDYIRQRHKDKLSDELYKAHLHKGCPEGCQPRRRLADLLRSPALKRF